MKSFVPEADIPWITTNQMIEVDRLMIEKYGILLIQMMENAGRALAVLSREFVRKKDRKIIVLAGSGGNGGGALVAARRLHNWGHPVSVFCTRSFKDLEGVPKIQAGILKQMGIPLESADHLTQTQEEPALILDGIIGYSLKGAPSGAAAIMINWANTSQAAVISLDTPSGIELSSGQIYTPAIKATATLTLALPKIGLKFHGVTPYRGKLYLADISVPPALYNEPGLNLKVPVIFGESDLLEII